MSRRFLLALLLAASCGDDSTAPDSTVDDAGDAGDAADAPDAPPSNLCDTPVAYDTGSEGDTIDLSVAGARAGRLGADQLPEDRFGLAGWSPGDYVLTNGEVAMIVTEANDPGQTYDPHGGRIAGFARVEDGALTTPSDFGLLVLTLGRFLVDTQSVTVMNDGSNGEAAVVRVAGPLSALTALGDTVTLLDSSDFSGSEGAIDFILEPGATSVDVVLRVRVARPTRTFIGGLQVFFQSNRTRPWRPTTGFGNGDDTTSLIAFAEDRFTSFGYAAPDGGELAALLSISGADIFSTGVVRTECGETEVALGSIVIGPEPGLPALQEAANVLTMARPLNGSLRNASGDPITDARIHLTTADGEHLTRFAPDEGGAFSLSVDGRAAEAFVWRDGHPLEGPFPVGDGELNLTVPDSAEVLFEVRDGGDALSPAKIEIFPTSGDLPSAPEAFGESGPGGGRARLAYTIRDTVVALAPGEYRVRIGRGPANTRFEQTIDIAAGPSTIRAVIDEVFPNPGVLCGDFHIHTHRSVDSPDRAEMKIRALAAEGVAIAVRTEHEFVADFAPLITEAGIERFVAGFGGLELTTVEYGHFIGFPLTPEAGSAGDGAPLWPGLSPTALFDTIRNRAGSPALIINHPRTGGALQGYFTAAGYDPMLGTVENPDLWDEEFEIVEVFNDSDFVSNVEGTVLDWFGLLNQGRRVASVGSSDSHRTASTPVGYPRTCLALGEDDPSVLTGTQVQDAVQSGRSVIYGGLDLRIEGPDGSGPGDVVSGVGDSAEFNVTLIAAEFVDSQRIEVYVDGALVETVDTSDTGSGVRFDGTVNVPVAEGGSWVVFHAAGDVPYNANGSMPFGVTNPVYLQR